MIAINACANLLARVSPEKSRQTLRLSAMCGETRAGATDIGDYLFRRALGMIDADR